ncbi:hypothetical protein Tco_1230155 [Tanacetum coccineum]
MSLLMNKTAPDTLFPATLFGGVTDREVFWGADEELSDGGSPRVIVYRYDGLPMQSVASPSLDYVPGPKHLPLPVEVPYVPEPDPIDHAMWADSDLEDEKGGGEGSGGDSQRIMLIILLMEGMMMMSPPMMMMRSIAFETDEAAPTHVPSPRWHTARMSVRPQTPVPLPSEAEVERLLALPIPPPSPLTPLSSPLPQIPSPPLPPPPSSLHLPPPVPTSLPLPLSPLPPLPASLFIPPVDRREDTSKDELPPRKRLCLTALTSRYKVEESSMAAPRPTGGHGADYGFIGTMDAEVRRQRAEEVGYGIRDVWVDPTETVEEVAPTTLEGVNDRVTELAAVQEQDTQDIYAVIEDTQDRQTQIYQRVDILAEDRQFHYETARLLDQEALGQLSVALGQIHALQARDQTHAGDREGAGSSA